MSAESPSHEQPVSSLSPRRKAAAGSPRVGGRLVLGVLIAGMFLLAGALALCARQSRLPVASLHLPPGFSIAVVTDQIPGARSMALSPHGILYVGSRDEGRVYAVLGAVPKGGEAGGGGGGAAGPVRVVTLASGLDMPNGVAWRDGALYVAEVSRLLRFDGADEHAARGEPLAAPRVLYDGYPKDHHHGWKFIRFGPDGWLYIPVGAPCNICLPAKPVYASITRIRPDGTGLEVFAHGVRNTVGFDWDPQTHELWFTDNGRDYLGDDAPPDELNHAPRAGMHFGYPFCHGTDISDPEFGKGHPCSDYTPTALNLPAHVASLGLRFYTGGMFPADYRNQIFIAEHGSWNRSVPTGYRVTVVRLQDGKPVSYKPFIEGWLPAAGSGPLGRRVAWGRPVDLQQLPDGSLLVSDDKAGAIYRVTYAAPRHG